MSDEQSEKQRLELLQIQHRWAGLAPHQREAALKLTQSLQALGENACGVLTAIAERLEFGAEHYKEDFTTDRDWFQESAAEAFDGAVYLALALTKLTKK